MNCRSIRTRISGCYLLLFILLTSSLLSADSPSSGSYNFPSNQQIITFLTETIEWYRYFSAERQIATEPFDLVFFYNNQPIGAQVVQLSFDFGRTDASLAATAQGSQQAAETPSSLSSKAQQVVQTEAKSEAEIKQATEDLDSIKTRLLRAHGADRKKLEAALADAQSRLGLLQARSKSLQNLAEFIQTNDVSRPQTAGLGSLVEGLARTVPEATNPSLPVSPPAQLSSSTSDLKPQNSGVLALAAEVSSLARKLRTLDEGMQRTNKLAQFSESLRTPLTSFVNQTVQGGELAADNLQSSNLGLLRQQTARLDTVAGQITRLAPAIAALDKQRVLLTVYKSRLTNWRNTVVKQYTRAWESLIVRLVLLGLMIAFVIGVAAALRRVTTHYVHDANRRRMILVVQRILSWLAIIPVIVFALAPDLSSLATFLGLLTAGIAVALQNVILAILGYFLMVGKLGIRIGDRLQVSGVAGDLINIGLLQFQLREIDKQSQEFTGQVATFSNSLVLVSPATGLFKFIPDTSNTNQGQVVQQRTRV
jgi:succinate dehydrogenase/fumarate reductase cytochrome b subunit